MKVLLINGSPHEHGCTFTALDEIARELDKKGIESEIFWLGTDPVRSCHGCGGCRTGSGCVWSKVDKNDKVAECREKLPGIDGIIVGSPVHYAGAS